MADVRWHFREMARGELNQNPMERELFAEEPINERLVREAIQNSLDASIARVDNSFTDPVRVRFSLQGVHEPLGVLSAAAYLDSLDEHLKAGLDPNDDFRRRVAMRGLGDAGMQYLVVEDAGTVGLEGDWERYDDSADDPAENEHFYWFFRNIGRSGKSDIDGGSWGLGKWVFPDASHASAYIAVTRRRSDGETLLMGQTVLTKHHVDGQRYAPYGYFGVVDEHSLALPLRMSEPSHRPFIQECIRDFGLQFRDGPGLSVIIPFPRVDEDPPIERVKVLEAIVHNYFYPIIAGRLEVVVNEGGGSESTEVTAETIDDVLGGLDLEDSGERSVGSYRRLFTMCRERAIHPELPHIELRSPPQSRQGYEHHKEVSDLRRRYEDSELLAFRIGMTIESKDKSKERTSFRLYVQHDGSLSQGHDFYVRGALSIAPMDLIGRHHARTLLVVDEREPLAAMLRDSEPPAHTMWYPQAERVTRRWVSARNRINEVRNAANTLLNIWESAPVELQRDALADIFPSGSHGGRRRSGVKVGTVSSKPDGPIDLQPGHPDFDIQRAGAGFRVRFVPNMEDPPQRVRVRAAYEVPRGNPMKSYNPHDFRLHGADSLTVQASGCQVSPGESGNVLILEVEDPRRFSLAVHGFDTHRDLLVDVKRVVSDALNENGSNA